MKTIVFVEMKRISARRRYWGLLWRTQFTKSCKISLIPPNRVPVPNLGGLPRIVIHHAHFNLSCVIQYDNWWLFDRSYANQPPERKSTNIHSP
eukprot:1358805-Rhodomonas_salina.1